MKKLIIILVATLLSFSALNAEQYHLKTSSGQSWKSVYSEKYEQHVAEINIEHHKLTILRLENKFRLLFQPIFYYDREILKYGKVTNYYYKHQYGVNVDGSGFGAWKKCAGMSEDTMPCHKTGEYYMIDLEEKHIDVLKKGNEIWYDTSTFTDDLTFTFSLKGFTEAFNESFTAKSMRQADLPYLVVQGDVEGVRKVLIEGMDPNLKIGGKIPLIFGTSALKSNQEQMLRLLVTAGANINAKNDKGDTLLTSLAHFSSDLTMFKLLLDLGADTEARDKDGRTVLDRTVNYDDDMTKYKLLIKAGANINARRKDNGMSILHSCISHTYGSPLKKVKFLIENGANINIKDNKGETPLMLSIRKMYTETAIYLLEKRARTYTRNNAGETARTLALDVSKNYRAMVGNKTQTKEEVTEIRRANYKYIVQLIDKE